MLCVVKVFREVRAIAIADNIPERWLNPTTVHEQSELESTPGAQELLSVCMESEIVAALQ